MLKRRSSFLQVVLVLAAVAHTLSAQMLYVGNGGDDTISQFVIDQNSGLLTEVKPPVASTGAPSSIVAHPSGKFVYATNTGNANLGANGPSLATFSIDPTTGALTLTNTTPLPAGSGPTGLTLDPVGKILFIAHPGANNISVYSLDPTTGTPTAISGSPFAAAGGPNKLIVHPNGKLLFAAANATAQVAVFNVAANGALTAATGSPFAARGNLAWIAMDAAGKFLFVAERQQNGVLVYAIDPASGALTLVTGSPFPTSGSIGGVAVDPTGKFLYATNAGGTLHGFRIGATGALTPIPPGFFPSQFGSFDIVVDSSGKFVYVTSNQANSVTAWTIDPASGALNPIPVTPYNTGALPNRAATVLLSPPIIPPIIGEAAVNYHSNEPFGMPNAGIAQGSRFGVYGENIGPAQGMGADPSGLQPQLGGVSIQIQSQDGTITPALMNFVSNGFVSAVAPSTTPLGPATVTVSYNGRSTAPLPATIVSASVGIRTLNDSGVGPAKAWNATPDFGLNTALSTLPANNLSHSAKPGQMMVVQATGLGAIDADETQQFQQVINAPATVIVGNKSTTPALEARVTAGSDYIAFQLPADVQEGCYVPLAIQAGGVTSNVASISIASSGASCSDPTNFAAADIDLAQKNGQLNVGSITLRHDDIGPLGVQDRADAGFERLDFNSLLSSFGVAAGSGIRGAAGTPALGTCTVPPGTIADPQNPFNLPRDETFGQFINVGQNLNLSGPQGSAQLPAPNYSFRQDGSITPGGYTIDNGAGAPVFGPFKASITLPPVLQWSTPADLTAVDRTQPLTITWTGGVADKEYVWIAGVSQNDQVTAGFLCAEKVAAGQFTIPAWVLSSLPPSGTIAFGPANVPGGVIGVGTSPLTSTARFNAPGLDFVLFSYEQDTISFTNFQ